MASAIVGALKVILSADTAEYSSALSKAGKEAAALSRDFSSIGKQMTAVGTALTKTITLPLVAMGAGAIKAASDFESSFAGVKKTVGDATDSMGNLTEIGQQIQQGLRDMAKEIPVSVDQLNRIGEAAGQLGIKSENLLSFTRVMADLGVTTSLSSEEAATSLAQLANITQMPQSEFSRLGSTIVGLGNNFATNESKIVDFGLRIAGAGKLAGLSEHQILAIGTAMASIGVEAEAGGTAVQKVLNQMTAAVATGNKDLTVFAHTAGMTAKDFATAFQKDAAGAFASFVNGLGQQGNKAFSTLDNLSLGNERVVRAFLSLGNAGDLLNRTLEEGARSWEQNSALTKEAQIRYQTFENQVQQLWNKVKDLGIELGTALLPAMKSLVGLAERTIPVVEMLVKAFTAMPTWVQASAVGLAAFVAAVGPVLWFAGQLITSIGTVIGAFKAKGIAMRALTTLAPPLVTGLTAVATSFVGIGALAVALVAALVEVGKSFVSLYNHWKSGKSMWDFFSARDDDNFVRRWLGLSKGVKDTDSALQGAADAANDAAAAMLGFGTANEFIGPILDRNANGLDDFAEAADEAKRKAEAFAASLKKLGGADAISGAREVVKQLNALGGPLNVLPSKLAEMAARLREGAEAAQMMGRTNLAKQYALLADTLNPIIQFQQKYNVTIGEYVPMADAAANATEWLNQQLGNTLTILPALQSTMSQKGLFSDAMFTGFKAPVRSAFAEAGTVAMTAFGDAFKNIGNVILQAVTGGGNILSSIGSSLGKALGEDFSEGFAKVLDRFLPSRLADVLGSMLPGIGALLGPALSAIGGGLKKLFGIGVNEEVKKANAEIQKVRQSLLQTHGSLDVLEQKARAVGLSFAENWGHQGQAGLAAFNELVEEFNQRWAELQQRREELESELGSTRDEFDGLIGKARELGYEFNQSGEFIGVNFDAVRQKADEFGVSVDGLGPRFRQQGIDAEAAKIINAFTLLSKAGGDVGGILLGMKDEIGDLVGKSIQLGTTIPENMKPWIAELIRTGQLVDENGVAITDLSQIKFGEPVQTEFEKITTALQDVVTKLDELIAKILSIPTDATFTVTKVYNDPGAPPGFFEGAEGRTGDPGHAVGTLGRWGSWFKDFGRGFSTALHGVEAVVTPQQAPAFAMDVLAAGMGGGSMGGTTVDTSRMEARLSNIERLLTAQPRHLAYAVEEVMQIRGSHK